MGTLFLLTFGTLAACFVLQFLLLCLTRNRLRPLRFAPLTLLAVPMFGMIEQWLGQSWFWELGVLLWALVGLFGLIGWALAWPLHRHHNKSERV